jgi:hypothetical protein
MLLFIYLELRNYSNLQLLVMLLFVKSCWIIGLVKVLSHKIINHSIIMETQIASNKIVKENKHICMFICKILVFNKILIIVSISNK